MTIDPVTQLPIVAVPLPGQPLPVAPAPAPAPTPAPTFAAPALPPPPGMAPAPAVSTVSAGSDDLLAALQQFDMGELDLAHSLEVNALTRIPPPEDGVRNVAVRLLLSRQWVPFDVNDRNKINPATGKKGAFVEGPGYYYIDAGNPAKNMAPAVVVRIAYKITNDAGAVVTARGEGYDDVTLDTRPRYNGSTSLGDFAKACALYRGLPLAQLKAQWSQGKAGLAAMVKFVIDFLQQEMAASASGQAVVPAYVQSSWIPRRPANQAELDKAAQRGDKELEFLQRRGVEDYANAVRTLAQIRKLSGSNNPFPDTLVINGRTLSGNTVTDVRAWGHDAPAA